MNTMRSAKMRKLMLKCTESNWYKDDTYIQNYRNALQAGYTRTDITPYHFYRFNANPVEQAEFFYNTAISQGDPVCAFVVDVEDTVNNTVGKADELKLFLDTIEYLTGFKPIIYTASWWWTTSRWGARVPWAKDYALIEAEYKYDPPVGQYVDFDFAYNQTKVISPTISPDWLKHSFWQFTSKARGSDFGATSQYIDVQSFSGKLSELNTLFTKKGTINIDPRPSAPKIDMLSYIRGPHGLQYEMQRSSGGQERYQVQWDTANPNVWYIVKGENQGYYERWSFDDNYIYLEMDTSPDNAPDGKPVYYTIVKNGQRSIKYKRFMSVGEVVSDGGHVVTFFNKSNCQQNESDNRSGNATNKTTFIQGPYVDTFANGITHGDVIKCLENTEFQYWARGIGRVHWEATWGDAQISEIHGIGQRPDVQREFIPCL